MAGEAGEWALWAKAGHEEMLQWGATFVETMVTGVAKDRDPAEVAHEPLRLWPWVMFLELTLLQLVLDGGLRVLVVEPLVKRLMLASARVPRKVTRGRVVKFAQSTLEALFYSIYFVMGARLVQAQPWRWPSKEWWTHQPDNRFLGTEAAFFYVAYCARYFHSFIMVMLEPARKDFWAMQIHHVVTVVLIYLSYTHGFVRVGLVIMVLLDIADPPLHLAKQFVYLRKVSGPPSGLLNWSNLADFWFVVFALSFTVTRMVFYPYVVWSCTLELFRAQSGGRELPTSPADYMQVMGMETIVCVALVWILQLLQVFWFYLLMVAVYKVIAGKAVDDERSDSELSDFEGDDKKDK